MRGYAVLDGPAPSRRLTTAQVAAEDLGMDFDPRLDQLVLQASGLCEGYCGRTFGRASWIETFDGFAEELVLSNVPVMSLSAVLVDGAVSDPELWRLRMASGVLSLRRPVPWWREVGETEVRYVAGWLLPGQDKRDLPDDIERACLETVKFLYFSTGANARDPTVRANSTEGIGQTSWIAPQPGAGSLPQTAADALAPYCLARA